MMKRLFFMVVPALSLWSAGTRASDNYIGAERCKTCHEFEYRVWASGPHAKAHESLSEKQLAAAKCSNCHTMLPSDTSARFVGVQCERCHGAGRYYHPDFVMKDKELARAVGLIDVKEEHCRQCHDAGAPSIEPFDFAAMWKEIDHGRAARAKWEASHAAKKNTAGGKKPTAQQEPTRSKSP